MKKGNNSEAKSKFLDQFRGNRTPTIVVLLISFLTVWSITLISIERHLKSHTEIRSAVVQILDHRPEILKNIPPAKD